MKSRAQSIRSLFPRIKWRQYNNSRRIIREMNNSLQLLFGEQSNRMVPNALPFLGVGFRRWLFSDCKQRVTHNHVFSYILHASITSRILVHNGKSYNWCCLIIDLTVYTSCILNKIGLRERIVLARTWIPLLNLRKN